MCHYITLIMAAATTERMTPVFPTYHLAPTRVENPSILSQLHAGEIYYLAKRGLCHCGTGLGSLREPTPRQSIAEIEERERLMKKGWSVARIQRWHTEKQDAAERRQQSSQTHNEPDARRWHDFFLACSEEKIGLLLHWYRGCVSTESFGKLRREHVSRAELSVGFLMRIEEDVIYEFG